MVDGPPFFLRPVYNRSTLRYKIGQSDSTSSNSPNFSLYWGGGGQLHSGLIHGVRAERRCIGRGWATVWVWPRRQKHQRTYCGLNLGRTNPVSTIAFVYLATLWTAQTSNTKYLADSRKSTGWCAVRSGSGIVKILCLHLSEGTEEIHAKPHSEWSGCGSRFELGTAGTRVELEQA